MCIHFNAVKRQITMHFSGVLCDDQNTKYKDKNTMFAAVKLSNTSKVWPACVFSSHKSTLTEPLGSLQLQVFCQYVSSSFEDVITAQTNRMDCPQKGLSFLKHENGLI
ncbi:hypothetical protein CHARACLAT_002963 [Characodon lateralis]|uniref:Uncharacterized protein n=1 Tax=Characodon lateralis TaxID=208331 RepID=A0ABU7EZU7_9TELE|nr:hypothetical protein [Characodon lateralis]